MASSAISPENLRPLPARPSLEFERKHAKKLLREMRRNDPASDFKLADAQFRIAREYGFLSWPKLVSYFTTLDRHERSEALQSLKSGGRLEWSVQWVLRGHANRNAGVARFLGTFVPRFYGRRVDEILASTVTKEDAQLVAARMSRSPSWEAAFEAQGLESAGWERYESPLRTRDSRWKELGTAMRDSNLEAVQQIVGEHPELLHTNHPLARPRHGSGILRRALLQELSRDGFNPEGCSPKTLIANPGARRITDWLVSQGLDLTETLNLMLIGGIHAKTEAVAFWLERGADPNWLPPNGISILEHALIRYWNGEAVDLIARRVVPKKAFWIAAGLGDTRSLRKYFDKNGALTDAARRHRPDFTAVFMSAMPSLPDADDIDIMWEAFFVAATNQRFAAIDALLEHGFPIDYSTWSMRLIDFAIGNAMVSLVDHLVKRGARVDARAMHTAEEQYTGDPSNADTRRVLELIGGNPAEALRRHEEEQRNKPLEYMSHVVHAFALAQEEAKRLGQTEVQTDNIFLGMLREESSFTLEILHRAGVEMPRLKHIVQQRLVPADASKVVAELPDSKEVAAVMEAIRTEAEKNRRNVHLPDVLYFLVKDDTGPVAEILAAAGASLEKVREACLRYSM